MPRPHEDLERHTPVDHRPGGPPIGFPADSWFAVEVAHVEADRVGATLSAYETLIEKARASSARARAAVILRSHNNRRVIAFIEIDGHAAFRHITAAWDDHHLNAEHRDVAESTTLRLYKFAASSGEELIDPAVSDALAFEHVARGPQAVREIIAPIGGAAGFRGAFIFGADDGTTSAILYRFAHAAEIDAFRASRAALDILGPLGAPGETIQHVHAVKTFA